MLEGKWFKILAALTAAAGFFLVVYKGSPKFFDIAVVGLTLVLMSRRETWREITDRLAIIKPYAFLLGFIFLFMVFATWLSFEGDGLIIKGTLKNLGRVGFSIGVLFLFAFLISTREKILPYLSGAFVFSFLAAIPAYWNMTEGIFIDGGRLKGFLQNPLIFGLASAGGFLVALGMFLAAKKRWQKLVLFGLLCAIADLNLWSASRGAWTALTITILFWFLISKRTVLEKLKYLIGLPVLVFLIGFLFLPRSPNLEMQQYVGGRIVVMITSPLTNQEQTRSWGGVVPTITENLLGFGLKANVERPPSDSTFFEVGFLGGVASLILFLFFVIGFLRRVFETAKAVGQSQDQLRDLKIGWLLAGAATVVAMIFTDAFLWRQVWVFFGVALGVVWLVKKPEESTPNR